MHANPEGFEQRPVPVRPLDEEQARLVDLLRAAHGETVSFEELRARGIDNPAVLCYELEIAGLPITHVDRRRAGVAPTPVGVRLEEPWLTGPAGDTRPSRVDSLLAWGGPAWERARSAALAGARGLAVHTRRAGAWLAGDVAWLASAAASLLIAAAAMVASTASSWFEAREQRSRAHGRDSPSSRTRSTPVDAQRAERPANVGRIGASTEPASAQDPRPSGRVAPAPARRADAGAVAAEAWLGPIALATGEFARTLRKRLEAARRRVDAALQATRARLRGGDVSGGRRTAVWVLAGVLVALALTGVAIALSAGSGGVPAKVAGSHRLQTPSVSIKSGRQGARMPARTHRQTGEGSPAATSSAHASGAAGATARLARNEGSANAAQLQAEGHRLLLEGRYAAAAADLRAAMNATGESTGQCQQPTTPGCLTYAYALYDLGRALQLEHRPAAAVPVLSERLRIDNQRPTVRSELDTARHQLHRSPPPPAASNSAPEVHEDNETHPPSQQTPSAPKPQPGSTPHHPNEHRQSQPQGATGTGESGANNGTSGQSQTPGSAGGGTTGSGATG
jgi:hypothetical protein